MQDVVGRIDRDVERLREESRRTSDTAMLALTEIRAHKDGCVEASERVQEKIDDTREAVRRVDGRIGDLKNELERERQQDKSDRATRQVEIDNLLTARHVSMDKEVRALRAGIFRIVVAIIVAGISIAGAVAGRALL